MKNLFMFIVSILVGVLAAIVTIIIGFSILGCFEDVNSFWGLAVFALAIFCGVLSADLFEDHLIKKQ